MSQTTQCPACQTRFKVSDAHLALASGMVRCGRCSHVFHAPSHFDAPAAEPQPASPPPVAPAPASTPQQATSFEPDDDFELELPDFQPEIGEQAPPQTRINPAQHEAAAPAKDDLDLPDYELMQPEPEAPLAWDDFDDEDVRYTPSRDSAPTAPTEPAIDESEASPDNQAEQQDLAAFQQALAEALNTGSRPARRIALFDDAANESRTSPPPAAEAPLPDDDYELPGRQEPQASRWQAREDIEPTPAPAPAYDDDEEHESSQRQGWLKNVLLASIGTLGVLLLAAQLLFINRTAVSAELPELRPAFESLCQQFGCEVPLPTQRQLIRTEWSELSFVPQHDHLIQLNATLRNLAPYPQALPLLELSLKDGDDQLIIRKTLKPEEYLSKNDLALGRFNANSEIKIVTRMEVSRVKALGYSLHFYYP